MQCVTFICSLNSKYHVRHLRGQYYTDILHTSAQTSWFHTIYPSGPSSEECQRVFLQEMLPTLLMAYAKIQASKNKVNSAIFLQTLKSCSKNLLPDTIFKAQKHGSMQKQTASTAQPFTLSQRKISLDQLQCQSYLDGSFLMQKVSTHSWRLSLEVQVGSSCSLTDSNAGAY